MSGDTRHHNGRMDSRGFVRLLGTGSADGWPNPWCACDSCEAVRASGQHRANTCALLDDRVLVDLGPDAPLAASRHGASLHDVHTVLLTHGHPDHLSPLTLLARTWTTPETRLAVIGPPSALELVRPWLGPESAVDLVPAAPGDRVEREGFVATAVAAAHDGDDPLTVDALMWDVTHPGGMRTLCAWDTGEPADEVLAALGSTPSRDLVLLECTWGNAELGSKHLNLRTFGQTAERMREFGIIGADTDLVAVHLSHHNPTGPELENALGEHGALAVPDGAVLGRLDAVAPRTRTCLVTGGARSGKSTYAEALITTLAGGAPVNYVATAAPRPGDVEWQARVELHRRRRPDSWITRESGDVAGWVRKAEPALVDCLALWLARVLDDADVWNAADPVSAGQVALGPALDALLAALESSTAPVVLVTNEVGSGVVPDTISGRLYRDLLGITNARVADVVDDVVLVVAGQPVAIKGKAAM